MRVCLATSVKDFQDKSFIEWDLKAEYASQNEKVLHRTSVQLTFRTRQARGLLFKTQNGQKSEYLILEVNNF